MNRDEVKNKVKEACMKALLLSYPNEDGTHIAIHKKPTFISTNERFATIQLCLATILRLEGFDDIALVKQSHAQFKNGSKFEASEVIDIIKQTDLIEALNSEKGNEDGF